MKFSLKSRAGLRNQPETSRLQIRGENHYTMTFVDLRDFFRASSLISLTPGNQVRILKRCSFAWGRVD
jgi:hypothetical protein